MSSLQTTYLGLDMKNPVIVSSCKLTSSVKSILECERAGAGAVVLKSLFEEQIMAEKEDLMDDVNYLSHAEAFDYTSMMAQEYYLEDYVTLVEEAKKECSLPIIASINCVSAGTWIDYAKMLEDGGADALELNVFIIPANVNVDGSELETAYLQIAKKIRKAVSIPVSMKIGFHFSGLAKMIRNISEEGIEGIVLFNRFYRPDVDIQSLTLKPGSMFSEPSEIGLSLQWIALLSGELDIEFSATTGIHSAEGVIKQLLVGAKTTQVCSTLYVNGINRLRTIIEGLENWMTEKKYSSISDFNGILCQEKSKNPEAYERSQFVKAIVGIS
jgi:dihydroorotate dehydrogenase (fumarate)